MGTILRVEIVPVDLDTSLSSLFCFVSVALPFLMALMALALAERDLLLFSLFDYACIACRITN